jgi:hypothetical protein
MVNIDVTLFWWCKTGHHPKQGCFAATAGAKKGVKVASLNVQTDIFDGVKLPESFAQMLTAYLSRIRNH